ncbi:hypothetical protein Tco_0658832 [Tanacetum coccineum]
MYNSPEPWSGYLDLYHRLPSHLQLTNPSITQTNLVERERKRQNNYVLGEILGVHSQGDCGNVTTDDNIAPEKDSIIAPPSTPPDNDLNIAAESGSSWIDYIGPLTSDEIDSDKRWSYRDPIVLSRATTFVERLFS